MTKTNDTSRWTPEIDAITAAFKNEFADLDEDQLNWKPNANTWSIAQNIHHLIVINQTYFPIIDALHRGTYSIPIHGKINFVANFLGMAVLSAVRPDRRKKNKTFPLWEPTKSRVADTILTDFDQHQADLKKAIENATPLLNTKTVVSSPANKNIVYRLDTAFDIIVTHEKRHLEQAREVRRQMPLHPPKES